MFEEIPRPLIALAAIVALVAIVVGVRDYFGGRKEASASTTVSAPATVQPNPADVKKKAASVKTRHTRKSATAASASAKADAPNADARENDSEPPLISDKLARNGLEATASNDKSANSVDAAGIDAVNDQAEASAERKLRARKASENAAFFAAQCVPLPNVTSPGDADGPYYQNWAREYSCVGWR